MSENHPVAQPDDFEYGYKVALDAFSGPLDLLLYLIRQKEVEIADIPIAEITGQYLAHVEALQAINVNLAGDFLLMAATLMEIKSRMLLPRHEGEEDEEEEDPRGDLIRQLLEYKRFKDAARALGERADEQALKFARGAAAALGLPERQPEDDLPMLLGDVTAWDLVAAFKNILRQTSLDTTQHIALDRKPIAAYCAELLAKLAERETATFAELFPQGADRATLISFFVALLELMRRRRLRAEQSSPDGEIRIVLVDATPLAESELPSEVPEPAEAEPPMQPAAQVGAAGEPEAAPASPSGAATAPPADAEVGAPAAASPPKAGRPKHWRPRPTFRLEDAGFEDADEEFAKVARRLDSIEVPDVQLHPPPIHLKAPLAGAPAAALRAAYSRSNAAKGYRAIPRAAARTRRTQCRRRARRPASLLGRLIRRRRPRRRRHRAVAVVSPR